MMRKPLWLSLLAMLVLAAPAHAGKVVDRVVAVVNGDAILLSDMQTARRELEKDNQLAARDETLSDEDLLQRLIDDKLANQQAAKLNIEVTDKEIDAAIDDVLRQYGLDFDGLKARLKEQGVEFADYRKKIGEQIKRVKLTNRAVRSRVVVDQNKMQAFYSEHREEFRDEPKVRLKQVLFTGDKAVDAANALYDQKSLSADALDAQVTKAGGTVVDLGIIRLDRLNQEFAKMVVELESGQVSPPFQNSLGVQLLYVQEKMPSRIKSFEEVKAEIEERLGREETERQFAKWLQELRDDSLIEVKL